MFVEDPIFLTVDDVLEFHEQQVALFGGEPSIRDRGLLESAVAQPRQQFAGQYLHEDLCAMAAAYLLHIVQNHPFADGNKRTGTHAAHVFLQLNGISVQLPVDETEAMVLAVATGALGKEQIAEFFRNLIRRQP
jgi:death-on-curing protein